MEMDPETGAKARCVDFSVPEAQLLADLKGVEVDLVATEQICDRFLVEMEKYKLTKKTLADFVLSDALYFDALFSAAVVRYGRTLSSSVRRGIPGSSVEALDPELRTEHQYFKDLRDKSIAHSVSPLEDNQVVLFIACEETGTKGITGVEVFPARVFHSGSRDILRLKRLANAIREKVAQEISAESDRVLQFARSMPLEPLYEQRAIKSFVPTKQDAHRVRRRFSRK